MNAQWSVMFNGQTYDKFLMASGDRSKVIKFDRSAFQTSATAGGPMDTMSSGLNNGTTMVDNSSTFVAQMLTWEVSATGEFKLVFQPPTDTTAAGTAAATATTTATAATTTDPTAAGTTTQPQPVVIYNENSSPTSMEAFQNYGGIAIFVNLGQRSCQAPVNETNRCTHTPRFSSNQTVVQACQS